MFGFLWNYLYQDEQPENPLSCNKKTNLNESPTDFYYLSLLNEGNGTWSIHGLWPQETIKKYPQYCKDVEFDIDLLYPIMDRLKDEWYSNRGVDEIFWKHEYLKHGTCNFNDFNEYEYFKTALDLFDKAMALKLADKYYNSETGKCLIPVNQQLNFFEI